MNIKNLLSEKGRITRRTFIIRSIACFVVFIIGIKILWPMITDSGYVGPGAANLAALLVASSIGVWVAQAIKRLHDINENGIIGCTLFVPLMNIALVGYLMYRDGTAGPNAYGEDPKGREPLPEEEKEEELQPEPVTTTAAQPEVAAAVHHHNPEPLAQKQESEADYQYKETFRVQDERFFSTKGRITRSTFIKRTLPIIAILIGSLLFLLPELKKDVVAFHNIFIAIVLLLGGLYCIIVQAAKRFQDVGMEAMYSAILIMPFLNLPVLIYLFLKDGTPGENEYGEDPKGRKTIAGDSPAEAEKNNTEIFFTTHGRIRRRTYFIRTLIISLPIIIIKILAMLQSTDGYMSEQQSAWFILFVILGSPLQLIQVIKRIHDIGGSGKYSFFAFVPIANAILLSAILFLDGDCGPNAYGEDPKGREPLPKKEVDEKESLQQ